MGHGRRLQPFPVQRMLSPRQAKQLGSAPGAPRSAHLGRYGPARLVFMRAWAYLRGTVKRLCASDLEAMRTFGGEAQTVEGTEPFTRELLDRLVTLVPCENVSFEEVNV